MKTIALNLFTAFCVSILSFSAFAGKVVVFDHQQALVQTDAAQNAIKALEASEQYKALVQQGEALRSDLLALQKEFETESVVWSEETRAEKSAGAEKIQRDLQGTVATIQRMQAASVSELAQDVQPLLEKILRDMMVAEKIDVIAQRQAVYVADPASDITAKVVAELNKALAAKK